MDTLYIIICAVLSLLVMLGISFMSKVPRASFGNLLSAFAILFGVVFTLLTTKNSDGTPIITAWTLYPSIIIGALIGGLFAQRVRMIQMPQLVALLNGLGGAASALVGILSVAGIGNISSEQQGAFELLTGYLAIGVGMITLVGSLVAAGKLHRLLSQRPQVWAYHSMVTMLSLAVLAIFILVGTFSGAKDTPLFWLVIGTTLFSSIFGLYFSVRVGGADMPITISLLNSLSGVAGAIAGMAINNVLLVAVGGIVGASGLLLTQIMCRAMNRSLLSILLGGKSSAPLKKPTSAPKTGIPSTTNTVAEKKEVSAGAVLAHAKEVIIVPGYGMALAQAQHEVKQLADKLRSEGARVRFAIHPVAGRMPGHMNVLLAEANVPYEDLYEMEAINDDFAKCDAVVVIGANDVLNPAARDAEGTPIYGMPVLNVDKAPFVVICNYDLKPGYAGVDNPLYSRKEGVALMTGDAKESLAQLTTLLQQAKRKEAPKTKQETGVSDANRLANAKRVIIVPGYGMALAQAQHEVKQLADKLRSNGAEVRFAIHPVAGRMPGHMNVLLAEANVPYEDLYEMEAINDDFAKCDAVVVIGANDVLNPAAREAEGTPIYGMPVLNVDKAPFVVICNYDLKPGYAGVDNSLYTRSEGIWLLTGDAKESLAHLLNAVQGEWAIPHMQEEAATTEITPGGYLRSAKRVIVVPGYGMALAQAQHEVKQLADKLRSHGADVRFAIHPVAGRMPGHMNVLLAEANVPYEDLYEMEAINDDFATCDAVVVIGANDVLNPAAREAEGTPIYGMPVLNVDQAPYIVICNYDLKPGYAGVENPLYTRSEGVALMTGDAKESVAKLSQQIDEWKEHTPSTAKATSSPNSFEMWMKEAKNVIIVPGYGMALAQAQHEVKQLADKLRNRGADVRFAIHPVAGRMPGHMNVLLAEANVPYEDLYEMEAINGDFAKADLAIVVGANDVLNPAARDAEGTPIYGMPVLNVDQTEHIVICNYDLNPGYAGVENPLYTRSEGVVLLTGDAKDSLAKLNAALI
ncbi:NAD(P)(+) transhydrogenase (Re/Si-specific) subunit beta [Porphyromonas circumdentaria]|uniref:NAD(P)(+) transhydrogenase (Re/Si-specific) subunit beta n=1 Tax=Porphyromonas circumdentaria TaxID=29524 RepID=UPI0026DBBBE5|nr:NAD(P)(+) transhydrogenase (Re/Si-specific) subunit beta [Porphyromonas circumdentaria]MDO4722896.1 NAD(P)(+) transhydrogenase (Re/Si-specific) subunit beta [Porphyromonas circumdentaria]